MVSRNEVSLNEKGLASQNVAWPQRMRSGLTEWGLSSENEAWLHWMRSVLTKWVLTSPKEVWHHRMKSGVKKWGPDSQSEVWPHRLTSASQNKVWPQTFKLVHSKHNFYSKNLNHIICRKKFIIIYNFFDAKFRFTPYESDFFLLSSRATRKLMSACSWLNGCNVVM